MINERELMERMMRNGDAFCLKKRPKDGEKPGVMGYTAFGVVMNERVPIEVYLRGHGLEEDFKKTKRYDNVDAMMADGWIVD